MARLSPRVQDRDSGTHARGAGAGVRRPDHQLWKVGGALRDAMLGIESKDIDYATSALPDEVESLVRGLGATVTTVGKRFGTIGVRIGGEWCEITTFRGDTYDAGGRWPDVTFGRSIEEDLARRDFTINALAEDALTGARIDLFGGAGDIAAHVVRAVGEPSARFREDPLRILRGLRFVSQLGFTVDPGTLAGMRETAPLTATLSQERVTAEFDRLLQGVAPAEALELVREAGVLPHILPELVPMDGCAQNRFHRFDVWKHSLATVAAIEVAPESARLRRWTALLHDIGKPAVRHVKANGEWGFYRHETAGATLAADLLARLKFGRVESHAVVLLIRRHMDRPDPRTGAPSAGSWRRCPATGATSSPSNAPIMPATPTTTMPTTTPSKRPACAPRKRMLPPCAPKVRSPAMTWWTCSTASRARGSAW